jgi:hypothetical protein
MQITRIFLCLACIANMALPAQAMPEQTTDDDIRQLHVSISDGYRLNFALEETSSTALKLTIHRSDGSLVKNAQVVIALIDHEDRHHLARADAGRDGYRVDTGPLAAELCRVEAEIITDGQLLTDHFRIDPTT